MNRDAQTVGAVWELVEAGGRTAQSFGLSRLFGQLYMLLYMSPEPRTLDELASELGVSKASVSIASRKLEAWGAVRRVWIKGDRRDFYEAETDFRAILNGGLLTSLSKKLESARIQIERSLTMLEQGTADENKKRFLQERLNRLSNGENASQISSIIRCYGNCCSDRDRMRSFLQFSHGGLVQRELTGTKSTLVFLSTKTQRLSLC